MPEHITARNSLSVLFVKQMDDSKALRSLQVASIQKGTHIRNSSTTSFLSENRWRSLGDYVSSDRVTIIGVWSEGFSCPRGSLSISQPSRRSASAGDNKKWSILMPRLFWNACRK